MRVCFQDLGYPGKDEDNDSDYDNDLEDDEFLKHSITRLDHSLGNVITSFPDLDEINDKDHNIFDRLGGAEMTIPEYGAWVKQVARTVFQKVDRKGYAIFYQSDRKGQWLDKSFLIIDAARESGIPLKWRKLALRFNKKNQRYVTYTNMLCFSFEGESGEPSPAVLYRGDNVHGGDSVYAYSMGPKAVDVAVNFIKEKSCSRAIVNPFVGRGNVLLVAKRHGLPAVGIDILESQCRKTRRNVQVRPLSGGTPPAMRSLHSHRENGGCPLRDRAGRQRSQHEA